MPSYPLTASSVSLTVGLPEGVLPLALLGGDRSSLRYDDGDLFALLVGFLVGAAVVRPEPSSSRSRARGLRALGGLALAGTWLLSPGFYTLILIAIAVSAVTWVLSRFLKGGARVAAFVVGVGMAGVLGLIGIAGLSMRSSPRSEMDQMVESPRPVPSSGDSDYAKDKTGNIALQQAVDGGILKGVTPVALSLPSYRHSMRASRELVTRVRPFSPTLYYVTEWALLPFGLFWLSCVLWVGYAHRPRIAALYRRIRDRLDRGPTPPDKKDAPAT